MSALSFASNTCSEPFRRGGLTIPSKPSHNNILQTLSPSVIAIKNIISSSSVPEIVCDENPPKAPRLAPYPPSQTSHQINICQTCDPPRSHVTLCVFLPFSVGGLLGEFMKILTSSSPRETPAVPCSKRSFFFKVTPPLSRKRKGKGSRLRSAVLLDRESFGLVLFLGCYRQLRHGDVRKMRVTGGVDVNNDE